MQCPVPPAPHYSLAPSASLAPSWPRGRGRRGLGRPCSVGWRRGQQDLSSNLGRTASVSSPPPGRRTRGAFWTTAGRCCGDPPEGAAPPGARALSRRGAAGGRTRPPARRRASERSGRAHNLDSQGRRRQFGGTPRPPPRPPRGHQRPHGPRLGINTPTPPSSRSGWGGAGEVGAGHTGEEPGSRTPRLPPAPGPAQFGHWTLRGEAGDLTHSPCVAWGVL